MKLVLSILGGFALGWAAISLLLGAAMMGNVIIMVVVILVLAAAGFTYSFIASKFFPNFFWVFGFFYIALPLTFISASTEGSPEATVKMRLTWFSILGLIYMSNVLGGLVGRKNIK